MSFQILKRTKPKNNTDEIKRKITEYHERGVCDRNGNTIKPHLRGWGKGDRNRLTAAERRIYAINYEKIDWSK